MSGNLRLSSTTNATPDDGTVSLRSRVQELEVEVSMLRRRLHEQQELLLKVELENDANHALATTDKELETA